MRLGLQIPHFYSAAGESIGVWLRSVAEAADQSGFHSIWLMDHVFQLGGLEWLKPVESPMLEGYSSLGYLAAATQQLDLGLLVSPPTYRPPGLLVKTVTTLDVLSGGRVWLGLGVGWYAAEARGLGLPFPAEAVRYEYLEDTLRLARHMWEGREEPFLGARIHLERPLNQPAAIRAPRPPVLIGGSGRKKTLRLVARYADACNIAGTYYSSADEIAAGLGALKAHCADLGRDYDEVQRTVLDTFDLSSDDGIADMIRRCRMMAALGIQTVIFNIPHAFGAPLVERIGREVVPAIADV